MRETLRKPQTKIVDPGKFRVTCDACGKVVTGEGPERWDYGCGIDGGNAHLFGAPEFFLDGNGHPTGSTVSFDYCAGNLRCFYRAMMLALKGKFPGISDEPVDVGFGTAEEK